VRPRPQPNQRRGLLRAALTVIVLTALLIIAIAIAGVVHQPAKPTPPTPPPTVNLTPPKAKPTPKGTVKPTTSPKARAAPTAKKTPKSAALAPGQGSLFERTFTGRRWPAGAIASPNGTQIAYFLGKRGAYAPSPLVVVSQQTGALRRVGAGDRLVRPAWSRNGRFLLYARVAPTSRSPGAMWSLVRADVRSARNLVLWRQAALAIQPLGWRGQQALYTAAEETDTAVYAVHGKDRGILGMLLSEPITNPVLSPSGRYIAFGAPTNCDFCTLNIYDLQLQWDWGGPSGMPRETDLAWGANDTLVASFGKKLAIVTANGYHPRTRYEPLPSGMPRVWSDPMSAVVTDNRVVITDTVSHRRYISG